MLTKIIGRYLPVWALLAGLLSGCLVSERPLITESMLPITNGTFVQIYDVTSDGTITPRRVDGRIVVHRLDIIDGAARIVDPIFAGRLTGNHVWGQFLKDYKPAPWRGRPCC